MTTASAWAIDIAGVPSILLEQITFSMENNGISGSPTSGGGEGTGKDIVGSNHDEIKPTKDVVNPQKVATCAIA